MVIPTLYISIALLSLSLIGCNDASLINTPRSIDTLDQDRQVKRIVDVLEKATIAVTVNEGVSACVSEPGSRCVLTEYSDGYAKVELDLTLLNRSALPTLPIDLKSLSLKCASLPEDTIGVLLASPYGIAPYGTSLRLYRALTESVDSTESTRVQTTVTRRIVGEQRTLNDMYITRTYNGFKVSDDTLLVPFNVFSIRDTELSVDTSYIVSIRHLGNRSVMSTNLIQPPVFAGLPIEAALGVSREGDKFHILLRVTPESNAPLQDLLGPDGSVELDVSFSLDD